jgi:hypothetical protein
MGRMLMAIYYTNKQKKQIGGWLVELREIVTPDDFNTASPSQFNLKHDRAKRASSSVESAQTVSVQRHRLRLRPRAVDLATAGSKRRMSYAPETDGDLIVPIDSKLLIFAR